MQGREYSQCKVLFCNACPCLSTTFTAVYPLQYVSPKLTQVTPQKLSLTQTSSPVRDTCNSVYHQLDVQTCEALQLGSIIWAVGGGRCSSVLSRWLSLGGRTHWRKVEVGTHWRKVNGRTRHEPPPSSPSRPSPGHPTTWIATMSGFS